LEEEPGRTLKQWIFKTNDPRELNKVLRDVTDEIISTYDIKPPTTEDEALTYNMRAHIIRDRSIEEYNEWIRNERLKMDEAIEERKHHK
jgi:hypothetical protein